MNVAGFVVGLLLFTVAATAASVNPTKVIHCDSCAHIKLGRDIGNATCRQGLGSVVVECNEETQQPASELIRGAKLGTTIAEMRQNAKDGRVKDKKDTVYGCATTQIETMLKGENVSFFWRSCIFALEPKTGCESGTNKELMMKPEIEAIASDLDDSSSIRICSCFEDKCNPENNNSSVGKSNQKSLAGQNAAAWTMMSYISVVTILLKIL